MDRFASFLFKNSLQHRLYEARVHRNEKEREYRQAVEAVRVLEAEVVNQKTNDPSPRGAG